MLKSSPIVIALLVSIATTVALVASLNLLGPIPLSVSQTTTNKQSTFDVRGESEVVTTPDQAEITVGVTTQANTVATAQENLNRSINQISNSLKDLGIEEADIKTTNYSINPNYNFDSGSRTITGYSASSQLRITITDLEKVNQVIDTATANGANEVYGITFNLSPEKETELKKQAREEAINDAKTNATELANLSGMKLGKIVNVYEFTDGVEPPIMYNRGMALDAAVEKEATQIEPGSTSYLYQVTLSYETL